MGSFAERFDGSSADVAAQIGEFSLREHTGWGKQIGTVGFTPVSREGHRATDSEGRTVNDLKASILSSGLGIMPEMERDIAELRARFPNLSIIDTTSNSRFAAKAMEVLSDLYAPYMDGEHPLSHFASSGSIANDNNGKLARAALGGEDKAQLYVFRKTYNGASAWTQSFCDADGYKGFGTLTSNAVIIENDGGNLRAVGDKMKNDSLQGIRPALVTENGLLGVGGFKKRPPEVMRTIMELVHEVDGIGILDDVQTLFRNGEGPLGSSMWAEPGNTAHMMDIGTTAKMLSNRGILGGSAVSRRVVDMIKAQGQKVSGVFDTFSQDSESLARMIWTVEYCMQHRLWENAKEKGDRLTTELTTLASEYDDILGEVVGHGALVGVEMKDTSEITEAVDYGIELGRDGIGLTFAPANGGVLRLPLPVNATDQLVDEVVAAMRAICEHLRRRRSQG